MMDKKFSEHSKPKKEEDMLENCSICCPDSALVQSSPVQFSCSVMSDSLQPHELQHTRPPCPSPTPRVYQNSCALSRWCHPAISSSVIPFSSCPQSLPASGSFPMSQLFAWGGQSIGVSASASVQFSSSTANMSCDRKLNIRFNLSSRSLGTHWRDNRQCDLFWQWLLCSWICFDWPRSYWLGHLICHISCYVFQMWENTDIYLNWLDSMTESMHMSLSKLQEIVKHTQESLVCCSPWGGKESDMT